MPRTARSLWVAFVAAACILVTPLFMVDVPPVADYPNHLARLYLLGGGLSDPILSRMYAEHWGIIPNLGTDLFVPWMLSFLPLNVAGRVMLAITLLLPVLGTIVYSRALFGSWNLWPFGSFLVSYNLAFLYGFHNLLLSYGAALLSAGLYHYYTKKGVLVSDLVAAFCGVMVFFIHIAGLALLLILIFSHKLCCVVSYWSDRRRAFREAIAQGCGFSAMALGPLGLYLASPLAESVGVNFWLGGLGKLMFLPGPILNYYSTLDIATAGLIAAAFIVCIASGRIVVFPPVCVAVAVLFIAYPYLPFATMTATFVDVRVPIALGFLIFCTFVPLKLPKPAIIGISALLVCLFVLRTTVVACVWYNHQQDLADLRNTIQPIVAGSRVLVVSAKGPGVELFASEGDPALQPEAPRSRFLSVIGTPTYEHMAALVLIERHAFWPLLFAQDGKQPLRVLAPYGKLALPSGGQLPDYEDLAADAISGFDLKRFPYIVHWSSNFDYVLLLNAEMADDLRSFLPDQLELLRQTGFAALFRIRK